MMCCGTGGAAKAEDDRSSDPKFKWTRITDDKEAVESLGVPGLLKVGSDVFAVAEAQCKKGENSFTGIASKLLTNTVGKEPEEVLKEAKKDTQILEEVGSEDPKKRVDVSRPTAVVEGSNIYILVGKHSHEAADTCQAETEKIKSGVLLVRGEVSGEAENKQILWKETGGVPCTLGDQHKTLRRMTGSGGSGVKMEDGTLVFPVEGTKKGDAGMDGKTVSLILYFSKEVTNWTLSKEVSADGCGDPSVVEWKEKLMMMTACDGGRRRVYESIDKGDSWTEALGTLSRVWGNKHKGKSEGRWKRFHHSED
ncbi:trans-sialidase [Trypanosoma cruzi Dm28c]|uniref:Trans-sialidase n=1 Tax=Trypanosoma cruzi Dm28c TaxID=1416333 RepID=V5B815_TRYCR|nr:trans-sialidase [Trypanosoma cruzi Dm28c]